MQKKSIVMLTLLGTLPILNCQTAQQPDVVTGPPSLSKPQSKLTETRTVKLVGLVVDPQRKEVINIPLVLTVGPNQGNGINISVADVASDEAHDALRATLWIAAQNARRIVGRPLEEYAIHLSCPETVDAPGLGALLAGGLIAAMTGASVREDVVVVGSLLPDGTVTPAAGLAQKFLIAAELNKHKFGYPLGQRYSTDLYSGEQTDLVAVSKEYAKEGIAIVELQTLNDVVKLLTDAEIAIPEAVAATEMALSDPEDKQVLVTGRSIVDQSKKVFLMAKQEQPNPKEAQMLEHRTKTERALEEAHSSWTEGRGVETLREAMDARHEALWDLASARLVSRADAVDPKALRAGGTMLVQMRNDIVAEIIRRRFRFESGMNQAMWDIAVYQRLLQAVLFQAWSESKASQAIKLSETQGHAADEQISVIRADATVLASVAWSQLQTAQDLAKLQAADGADKKVQFDEATLHDVSLGYLSTARAFVNYAKLLLGPVMNEQVLTPARLAYETANGIQTIPDRIVAERWGADSASTAIVRLAGAKESAVQAALLMYQVFYPHDKTDANLEAKLVSNAALTARQFAHTAKQRVGTIPLTARLAFAVADSESQRGNTARALELYWRSALESQEATWLTWSVAATTTPKE